MINFLNGYKTYIMAAGAVIAALVAYQNGTIDGPALAASLWAAVQTVFLRSGSKADAQQTVAEVKKAM